MPASNLKRACSATCAGHCSRASMPSVSISPSSRTSFAARRCINHLDAVRALQKAGFEIVRQGKHIVMSNGTRILTILRHDPVNAFTLAGIVHENHPLSTLHSRLDCHSI